MMKDTPRHCRSGEWTDDGHRNVVGAPHADNAAALGDKRSIKPIPFGATRQGYSSKKFFFSIVFYKRPRFLVRCPP